MTEEERRERLRRWVVTLRAVAVAAGYDPDGLRRLTVEELLAVVSPPPEPLVLVEAVRPV